MQLDAPGNVVVNIDTNDNSTQGAFKIMKDGSNVIANRIFEVSEGGHITASGDISSSGTIIASQFNDDGTNLNVPDYVFETKYVLKSLDEVEEHISESKHLPNIPSMEDISSWSKLSYGDRDMKLLEKIEELTLYIINLQKQVDELKNKS
jgi:hypothetical protein